MRFGNSSKISSVNHANRLELFTTHCAINDVLTKPDLAEKSTNPDEADGDMLLLPKLNVKREMVALPCTLVKPDTNHTWQAIGKLSSTEAT